MSLKRHTAYNLLGAIVPIAVSLVTVPAYLAAVGDARFGILAVTWLLLGYFGLFDLGLGMATSHHIAAAGPKAETEVARLFWTSLLTNLLLGIVGGLAIWPIARYYFGHVMIVDTAMRAEMLASVPWLVLAVPVATTTGVLTGVLQGLNRFGRLNFISVTGTVLFQILPLTAALLWSPSLAVVLPVALAAKAVSLALLWIDVRPMVWSKPDVAFSRKRAIAMLKFGGWVTISALFAPFMIVIDRFAIGGMISAAAVSYYAVPFNLADRLTLLGNSLGSALFPRLSAVAAGDLLPLAVRSERALMAAMLPVAVGAIFAVGPFLNLWVGEAFAAKSSAAAMVLMVGIFFDAVSRVPLYALRSQSRPQAVAKVDLIQLLPYWALLYFALSNGALAGAAWAYVARVFANYFLLSHEVGSMRRTGGLALVSALVLLGAWAIACNLSPWSVEWLGGLAACLAISCGLSAWLLPVDLRQSLTGRLSPSRLA